MNLPRLQAHLNIRSLLWLIYIALLGVLLPHTAWAFERVQSSNEIFLAWLAAFVFEASVFGFTHSLVKNIERSQRLRQRDSESWYQFTWRKFSSAYLNGNGFGLLVASSVSALANFTYTVQFSQPVNTFTDYSLPPVLYHISFGGILPLVSLLFAHILAKPVPHEETLSETEVNLRSELKSVHSENVKLRLEINGLRLELTNLQQELTGFRQLFTDDKRVRIEAATSLFPKVNSSAIAQITDTSPAYVSQVLNGRPR